ncbi:AlpA family phage regulatory protein [uncultured Sneathiella sp.]|jgi:prophage regulatory protein|uniref:helix-turn-helix transcriptional regulator n=1 Tax=uncultured Sneathiella sp. TaxID=879315 RepID=UPI0030DC1B33|tara:strand:- start:1999 stop:2262 length:264 start_codon:yes stop_codon:yes gene_type:complete
MMENDADKSIRQPSPELLLKLNAFMNEKAVITATSLSRTAIHRKRLAGEFPEPEEISDGRVGYRIRDVKDWLADPTGWVSPQNSPDI